MNKVIGKGQLRHRFWGTYSAVIILAFKDTAACNDAYKVLNSGIEKLWKVHESESRALYCVVGQEDLDNKIIPQLVSYGAEEKKIASLAKSIDFGEPFQVEIPVVPNEQTGLFSEEN